MVLKFGRKPGQPLADKENTIEYFNVSSATRFHFEKEKGWNYDYCVKIYWGKDELNIRFKDEEDALTLLDSLTSSTGNIVVDNYFSYYYDVGGKTIING